jgi:Transglutaminase-like superfamily
VSFISASRRFAHLTGSDRTTVLSAALWLSATWIGLRVLGFRRWKLFLDRLASSVQRAALPDPARLPEAVMVTRLLSAAARHLFFPTNCLEQALTLYFLLRRRGLAAELHFGARKSSAALEAHAWVAYLGVPLGEDLGAHRHFLPFAEANPVMETLPD